jgi:hypothetical protein
MDYSTKTGRLATLIALAVAAATLAVPIAQAKPTADNPRLTYLHRGLTPPGGSAKPVADNPHLTYLHRGLTPPGGRAKPTADNPRLTYLHRGLTPPGANGAARLIITEQAQVAQPLPAVSSSPGFDWGDAGIGAAAAFGLMLLAAAVFHALRRGTQDGEPVATADSQTIRTQPAARPQSALRTPN